MATYSQYKIQTGDTLSKIAKKFKTTVSVLRQVNNISNPNMIRAGNTLSVPVTESTPVIDAVSEGSVGSPFSAIAPAAKAAGWFQPPKLYYLIGAAALFILVANRIDVKPYYDGK